MIYLLDTNAWASYLNRRTLNAANKVAAMPPDQIRLCAIVKADLYYGAYKSSRPAANLALLGNLSRRFISIDFDDRAAEECGRIRAHLAVRGTPIGPSDVMIAATALANNLIVVTHNTSEFSRVPGLTIEDWEATP